MLEKVFEMAAVGKIVRHIHVFSRTSPNQKTAIVAKLNNEGNITMMTGDGTNDVGSLKRADVGLAIVNNPAPSKEMKKQKKTMSMYPPKDKLEGKTFAEQRKIMEEHMQEYQKVMMAQAGDPTLELGDACIAAPFTFKFTSLKSVKRLIREGFSFLFIFLSFTQPLKKLYKERPPNSIFHWSLVVSVFGQFSMHLYVLKYLVDLCEPYIDRSDESFTPDGEFKPNLKNSVMFVYQWWLQCAVILVNYSGRPFMQSMSENKKLKYLLALNFLVLTCCIFNGSDELRETFELVPYPNEAFKQTVINVLVLDLAFCYILESIMKALYLRTFQEEEL